MLRKLKPLGVTHRRRQINRQKNKIISRRQLQFTLETVNLEIEKP